MLLSSPQAQLPLPTSEELPCSDETPVDNEGQNTIPNGLLAILEEIWDERQDWFFGVDMGIYDRAAQAQRTPCVVSDGFLSLGVTRHKRQGRGRLSYVLQEENDVAPILVLEFVSKTYGNEYDKKLQDYARLGVSYYIIYNPEHSKRDRHDPFEVYRLEGGTYQRQPGEPVWMPEIGLGIGRVQGKLGGVRREWLAWHNPAGQPYPLPREIISQLGFELACERQRTQQAQEVLAQTEQALAQERLEKEQLLAEQQALRQRLQELGIENI